MPLESYILIPPEDYASFWYNYPLEKVISFPLTIYYYYKLLYLRQIFPKNIKYNLPLNLQLT